MNDRAAPFHADSATAATIADAARALGDAPLTERGPQRHVAPLFSRTLAARDRVYLANHSLGRPLDAVADDVSEALREWTANLGRAWDAWEAEAFRYRTRFA